MPKKEKNYSKIMNDLDSEDKTMMQSLALNIAHGRKDPVFFGEYFLGVQFHPLQKIWLWLTTKTQIEEAHKLAQQIGIKLPGTLDQLLEHNFLKNILCPSNRFGKTFVTSVKHIWYNFYKIGVTGSPDYIHDVRYSTLNISPHSMQVDAAYRYIIDIFNDRLIYMWEGQKRRNICRIKSFLVDHKETKREIHFANDSMVKGVPTGEDQASSLAGTQFFYISYDEAPQSLHLRVELPAKIQSRLIDSGGPLDIIGTPEVDKPSHPYYHRLAKFGLGLEKGFFTLTGKLADNIFLGEKEKRDALESIKQTDPEKYRQVAFGEFITSGAKLFPTIAIERLFWKDTPIERGIGGHKYIISADWGFSDTGDPSVFYIVDYTRLSDWLEKTAKPTKSPQGILYEVVFSERVKGGSPYETLARLRLLQQDFNDAIIIHDSSSMGGVIITKMLRELSVRHLYDFTTAKNPKDEMLFLLANAMADGRKLEEGEDGMIKELNPDFGKIRSYYIPELEEQLGNYRMDDKKIEQDEVISLGMGIWYLEKKLAGHRTKVFNVNIFANKPQDILSVPGEKRKTGITERTFNITERKIG
jgi:hypothetical protein